MVTRRAANDSLRMLLSTADWTYEALARNVNALGAENGMRLCYDRTSVAHWLAGSVPRPRTRELIAEAFTRRLRRPVALTELGMGDSAPDVLNDVPYGGAIAERTTHAVVYLAALCGMDADPARQRLVHQSVYSVRGLDVPVWPERSQDCCSAQRPTASGPTGSEDVESLRAAVDFFHRAGDFGGRHARSALVSYLHDDVVPRLHAKSHESTHLRLLTEAARLVHVLARMYVDDVKNGAAQQYHRAALLLAAEASDRTTYAVVLRSMSTHALDLGHHRLALRLSEAAVSTVPADAPHEVRASLLSQLALAQAAVGDRCRATASLATAERHQHQVPAPGTAGHDERAFCSSWASLAFWKGRTLAALGDRAAAIAALRLSVEYCPATAYLSRALAHAEIARLLLGGGRLDESCAACHRFLDDHLHLRSGRADRILAELRGSLRVHAAHPPVRALLRRADRAVERPR
ncbi:hypothetical protein ABZ250_08550 [Streptomyces afghaniensis]|uniref:hypothetical protein n=1 Tax=Streptomyces afghaniensis TaxID=66865 RepID=UPI0033BAAE5D